MMYGYMDDEWDNMYMLSHNDKIYPEKLSNLVLELSVILLNMDKYPDVTTLGELFHAMGLEPVDRTDYLLAELMRELINYPEVEEEENIYVDISRAVVLADKKKQSYVEIPAERLYAQLADSAPFQRVDTLGFLKLSKYMDSPKALPVIPYLKEKVDKSDKGLPNVSWFVSAKTIMQAQDIGMIRDFLLPKGDTVEFICGDEVYSLSSGVFCQHGKLVDVLKRS